MDIKFLNTLVLNVIFKYNDHGSTTP